MKANKFKVNYAVNVSCHKFIDADIVTNGPFFEDFFNRRIASGLSMCTGVVENKNVSPEMDAISLIDSLGNLSIYDISAINIPGDKLDMYNPIDRYQFIALAKRQKISTFQSHLLINNNKITFYKESSNQCISSRKLLAVLKDDHGVKFYALIFLPEIRLTLYDASEIAQYLMSNIGYTVDKLIDLDTGASDYLRVSNEYRGSHSHLCRGKSNNYVDGNQRLLSFYRLTVL